MAAPSYSYERYTATPDPSQDVIDRVEARLVDAGWQFVEQVAYTDAVASVARYMRVWRNPATLNMNGVAFHVGLIRNQAAGGTYFGVRMFESWDATAKSMLRPTMAPQYAPSINNTGVAFTNQGIFAGGQFVLPAPIQQYSSSSTSSSATCFTSPDGVTWTARRMPFNHYWSGVAYGNGTYVAVAGAAVSSYAMTYSQATSLGASSPDGVTWTQRTLPVSAQWSAVTYGSGPGLFVAISYSSASAASSPDGFTWTTRGMPQSAAWCDVAYGNGTYVAVAGVSSTQGVATSTNGTTWTLRTLPTVAYLTTVTYGNGLFVAGGQLGAFCYTSPDGITWTQRTMPTPPGSYWQIAFGNGSFVATSGNLVAYSADGLTWTSATGNCPSPPFRAIYGAGQWVIPSTPIASNYNTTALYTATDLTTSTPFLVVARGVSWLSPSAPGNFILANPAIGQIALGTTSALVLGVAEYSFTLPTNGKTDMSILASKSYLVVNATTNNSRSPLIGFWAGAFIPAYSDATTNTPALAFMPLMSISGNTLIGSATRNHGAIPDSGGYHYMTKIVADGIPLGLPSVGAGTPESISGKLRGTRAAVLSGDGAGGYVGRGGLRGWLPDTTIFAASGPYNAHPTDTVTVGPNTYQAMGVGYAEAGSTTNYATIYINSAAGS